MNNIKFYYNTLIILKQASHIYEKVQIKKEKLPYMSCDISI